LSGGAVDKLKNFQHMGDRDGNFLFLDGSLSPCRVGVVGLSTGTIEIKSSGRPLNGLFAAVEELLSAGKVSWNDISAFAISSGPGNLTGLRSVKMFADASRAISLGRPIYAFCGLELAAQWILESQQLKEFSLVAPISKRHCAVIAVADGTIGEISRGENCRIETAGPIFAMETGFPLAAQFLAADLPPMEFIVQKLSATPPLETFEPITLR
jgi:prepilin-type processing-associated H-X9-DG protein